MARRRLVAFDVDGTLADYGGCVTRSMMGSLKPTHIVGLVTGRADHAVIREKYGLDFSYQYQAGVTFKQIREQDYPGLDEYVYVADNVERKQDAESNGFKFLLPHEFCSQFGVPGFFYPILYTIILVTIALTAMKGIRLILGEAKKTMRTI